MLATEHPPAVTTPVRLDYTMFEKMHFNIAVLSKRLPTFIPSVLFDSTMLETMAFQTAPFSR